MSVDDNTNPYALDPPLNIVSDELKMVAEIVLVDGLTREQALACAATLYMKGLVHPADLQRFEDEIAKRKGFQWR